MKIPRAPSALEERFWWHCLVGHKAGTIAAMPAREHRFHAERKWRFDFAWVAERVAVECEGAIWAGGRHTRGAGFEADCEKLSEAAAVGWLVIRATKPQIDSGRALEWARRALEASSQCHSRPS